jgi:hypothetical protein
MTNEELKEKYYSEKGIRWYDNWADYANWLEDALIEALGQPPVIISACDEIFEQASKVDWALLPTPR